MGLPMYLLVIKPWPLILVNDHDMKILKMNSSFFLKFLFVYMYITIISLYRYLLCARHILVLRAFQKYSYSSWLSYMFPITGKEDLSISSCFISCLAAMELKAKSYSQLNELSSQILVWLWLYNSRTFSTISIISLYFCYYFIHPKCFPKIGMNEN